MFEKIYLDRKACVCFYVLMNICLKLIHFFILGMFVYFLWEQRYNYMSLFEPQVLLKAQQSKQWDEYYNLIKSIGEEGFYTIIKLIIVSTLIVLLKYCKIPNIWLKKWDDEGQINNIFGKKLVNHLRYNRKLNFKDFNFLNNLSIIEKNNLKKVNDDPNLVHLMNKYDKEFNEDFDK